MDNNNFSWLGITPFNIIHELTSIRMICNFNSIHSHVNFINTLFSIFRKYHFLVTISDTLP